MNNTIDTTDSATVYGLKSWDANKTSTPTAGIKNFEAVFAETLANWGRVISHNVLPFDRALQDQIQAADTSLLPRAEFFKFQKPAIIRYLLLKKLEGTVVRVDKEYFVAHLMENSSDFPLIEVEIDFSE